MELDKYKKVNGRIVKEDEMSLERLEGIKVDALKNIALLEKRKQELIKEYDETILKWQNKIIIINNLAR